VGGKSGRRRALDLRVRQTDQSVSLHTRKSHPARHVLELPVGLGSVPRFTQFARQRRTLELELGSHQIADRLDFFRAEITSTVNTHVLFKPSKPSVMGQQRMAASRLAFIVQGRNGIRSLGE